MERIGNLLTKVHVSAHRRIPLARLNILPQGTLLQVKTAYRVKHVQMYHGMQAFTTIVALSTRSTAYHTPLLID